MEYFGTIDQLAANLITSDIDDADSHFVLGERTPEGFFKVKNGPEAAISRGLSYAPYSDLIWCETGQPDIGYAKDFADAIHEKFPDKLLAYNCSPYQHRYGYRNYSQRRRKKFICVATK